MCFVWISEQTAITPLYSINGHVSISKIKSIYCAVRAEYLNAVMLFSVYKGLENHKAADCRWKDNYVHLTLNKYFGPPTTHIQKLWYELASETNEANETNQGWTIPLRKTISYTVCT